MYTSPLILFLWLICIAAILWLLSFVKMKNSCWCWWIWFVEMIEDLFEDS